MQNFGAVNGRVQRFGRPLMVGGELVGLVQTPVTQIGRARMIQPDALRFKVRTANVLVTASVSVDWMQGRLSLGQRCYGQTGQGMQEEGCEVPVEAERVPSDEDETFVRLFAEATEQVGPPKHVVVRKTSVDRVALGDTITARYLPTEPEVPLLGAATVSLAVGRTTD